MNKKKYYKITCYDMYIMELLSTVYANFRVVFWRFSKNANYEYYQKYKFALKEIKQLIKNYIKINSKKVDYINVPEIHFTFINNIICFKIRFLTLADEKEYQKIVSIIKIRTNMQTVSKKFKDGFYIVEMGRVEDNIPIKKFLDKEFPFAIPIGSSYGKVVYWIVNKYPHLLVVGATGSGKTSFIYYLLSNLLRLYKVDLVDGKSIDFSVIQSYFNKYADGLDIGEIITIILDFEKEMLERIGTIKDNKIRNIFTQDVGLQPRFLFIEEHSSIIEMIEDKKVKERVIKAINNITRLGRAVGMFIISSMQRPDTKYLSGDSRNNYLCKIVLGTNDNETYRMMYDKVVDDIDTQDVGRGYARIGPEFFYITVPFFDELELEGEG